MGYIRDGRPSPPPGQVYTARSGDRTIRCPPCAKGTRHDQCWRVTGRTTECSCPQCCTQLILELNDYHLRMPIGHPSREKGLAQDCLRLRDLRNLLLERRKKEAARPPLPPFACAGPGCTQLVTDARRSGKNGKKHCSNACRQAAYRARKRSKRHPEPQHPLPHRWESDEQFQQWWQAQQAS